MSDHCPCMARIQFVRGPYEFAITPMNIDHDEFDSSEIATRCVHVTCTICGTKFYVGMMADLYSQKDRDDADKLQALLEIFQERQRPS